MLNIRLWLCFLLSVLFVTMWGSGESFSWRDVYILFVFNADFHANSEYHLRLVNVMKVSENYEILTNYRCHLSNRKEKKK